MLQKAIFLAAGIFFSSTALCQMAPPPPDVWKAQLAFFEALPVRFPAPNIAPFENLVADNVQVYRNGALIHRNRTEWIGELQSYRQKSPSDPQGYTVSRDQYMLLEDGSVSVREFSYPIPPEGNTVIYHPSYPSRYVSYRLDKGKVVRVNYSQGMTSYAGLCQLVAKNREAAGDKRTQLCD